MIFLLIIDSNTLFLQKEKTLKEIKYPAACYIVFLCMVFHIVNHICHDVINFPNPDAAASYIVL